MYQWHSSDTVSAGGLQTVGHETCKLGQNMTAIDCDFDCDRCQVDPEFNWRFEIAFLFLVKSIAIAVNRSHVLT